MTPEEGWRLIEESRARIDALDRKLVELLNERTRMVERIGRAKAELDLPVKESNREDDVFRNVLGHNAGPIPPDALRRVFERIIEEMRELQGMRRQSSGTP
ncbi:MAG: chorismate mutase [Bryobacterales bacterium]|nr:chorismate mutase [Bryobacterales bacterium]